MHAHPPAGRRKARTPHVIKFRVDDESGDFVVERIAAERGLVTIAEKAAFFGSTVTTWRRLLKGKIDPGEETIAAVLGTHKRSRKITFDKLFEVVSP